LARKWVHLVEVCSALLTLSFEAIIHNTGCFCHGACVESSGMAFLVNGDGDATIPFVGCEWLQQGELPADEVLTVSYMHLRILFVVALLGPYPHGSQVVPDDHRERFVVVVLAGN
jgi:hypothetical protein